MEELNDAIAAIAASIQVIRPQFAALNDALVAVPAPADRTPEEQAAIDAIREDLKALLDVSTDAVRGVALFRLDA